MKNHLKMQNKLRGFTLVETLVSLMIFSIALLVMWMTLQTIRSSGSSDSTDFYMYLDVIENHGYTLERNKLSPLTLKKANKLYFVKLSKNRLVMSTNHGGYIPLLSNVNQVKWDYRSGILTTKLQMNGNKWFSGKSRINEK